jgi:hypothetical protein
MNGIPTRKMRFGDLKPAKEQKINRTRASAAAERARELKRARKRRERISNKRGRYYERLVGMLIGIPPFSNGNRKTDARFSRQPFIYVGRDKTDGMGVDFISTDRSVAIEVKGTNNPLKSGTFGDIKTINGELSNRVATHFFFVTPRQFFVCDANRLREFVRANYAGLEKFQYPREAIVRVKLEIDRMIRAGVFATPSGHVQGWDYRMRRRNGEWKLALFGPFANKVPLPVEPKIVSRPRKPIIFPSRRDRSDPEDWPDKMGMGRAVGQASKRSKRR